MREIPGRPALTENSPFRLGPRQLTPYSTGVTSGAVSHYQHPLRNPVIDDGLFPHFCLRGHCKRTSSSAGTLGQNSRCPWSPSCHREGPPQCAIDHSCGSTPEKAGKRGRMDSGVKGDGKVKRGRTFIFAMCPSANHYCKLPEWKRVRKPQWD